MRTRNQVSAHQINKHWKEKEYLCPQTQDPYRCLSTLGNSTSVTLSSKEETYYAKNGMLVTTVFITLKNYNSSDRLAFGEWSGRQ